MIDHDAIRALNPSVINIDDDIAYDKDGKIVKYDVEAAKAWKNPELYKIRRRKAYPDIRDQLDALFHAGVFPPDMAAQIQAVKDKYPKS